MAAMAMAKLAIRRHHAAPRLPTPAQHEGRGGAGQLESGEPHRGEAHPFGN